MTHTRPTMPLGTLLLSIEPGISPKALDRPAGPGELGVLKVSAVTSGVLRLDENKALPLGFDISGEPTVQSGDLLISRANTIEYVGAVAVVETSAPNLVLSDKILRLVPHPEKADPLFLMYALRTPPARRHIESRATGTSGSMRNISQNTIQETPIPSVPVHEQRRIAAILARADAIRHKRQEAIALSEQLIRSSFLEMFGDPVSNPKRWPTKSLGKLATFTGGGTPSRSVPEYFDGATCWATSKDMKGEVLSDTEEHITDDAIQNSATKLVPPGTILVVVKSKILMHRLPVLVAAVPTCFGQDLKGLSLRDPGLTYYVARHMRIGQDTLLRRARGVNTEGLTLEHLAEYAVMQPPSEMIDRYVKFELATTKAARVSREARADADHLFNSLVQRAFSGQL